jgi:N-methylhydantoinase B
MDVMLLCPVFWKGELFCWVTNCLHQYDIGGITPGSFCPSARDAFDEGILIPPIKIVEGNEIRRDIEEVYLRSSRKPSAVALDFRAQLAGNMTAKGRVLALISRYGAETVKGVMKKIIDDGERAFLKKLLRLPDGIWRDRTYVECCRPGDRSVHRVMITLKKEKNRLVFENEGTDPQAGAINATYSGWRGAIMVALNELLCWDQYYAVGGALRHVEFNPTPGTLNCADFPASVSTAPVQCMEISLYPAYNVLSKMLYPDPELRRDVMCIGGTSQWPATIFRGIDQWGERYGYLLVDPIGGAIGAFSHADGISTGGQARTPICKLPNVEHTEQSFPVLFLYRKEITDSGGAGKWRGGLSAESCFIPHGTDSITHDTLSSGNAIPTSTGMMGGYPGAVNRYRFVRSSDVLERMKRSELIHDIDELEGKAETLQLRQQDFTQNPMDVYAVLWSAAGGFGDPLERDPAKVAADVDNGDVSPEAAKEIYGVVLNDPQATALERDRLRHGRIGKRSGRKLDGKVSFLATENLAVRANRYSCAKCATDLASIRENYKSGCVRNDLPIKASNPIVGDPARFIDPTPQFRQFCCPGCGLLIENEIAIADDPILMDVQLR